MAGASKNNIKGIAPCYGIYHDAGYKESDVDVEVTMCINENVAETDRIKIRQLEEIYLTEIQAPVIKKK